ncbi:hypothetical protein C8R42DRAFT_719431 [Lentinula raphanica]|nr:hypothetical protein C8R42DRAFT_719431 [Lentinula raphanica]
MADIWLKAKDDLLLDMESRIGLMEPKAIRSDQDKQELEKITENQAGQLKTAYRELHDATAMQVTPRISEQATQTLSDPLDDLQVQVQQSLENADATLATTLSDPADDLQTQLQQSLDKADATLATLRIENNTLQAEVNETRSCKLRMQQSLEETCDSNTKMLQELESVKIDLKSTYERKQELEQTTADQVAAHEELRKVMAMQLEQLETIKIDLETTRRQKEEIAEGCGYEALKAQMSEQAIQTQLDPPFLSSEDCLELVIRRDELFKCREHCLQLEQSALEATSKYGSQQLIQTKIRQAELQIHQNIIRLLEESLDSLENDLSSREEEVRALRADLTS